MRLRTRCVCVCVCVRERERISKAKTSIPIHLHTGGILRSFNAVSQVNDNKLIIHLSAPAFSPERSRNRRTRRARAHMHTDIDPYFVPQFGLPVAILGASRAGTSHSYGTCLRQVCRGSSDDDFGGPTKLPHAICESLWHSPDPPWSFRGLHIGVRSAPVSLM